LSTNGFKFRDSDYLLRIASLEGRSDLPKFVIELIVDRSGCNISEALRLLQTLLFMDEDSTQQDFLDALENSTSIIVAALAPRQRMALKQYIFAIYRADSALANSLSEIAFGKSLKSNLAAVEELIRLHSASLRISSDQDFLVPGATTDGDRRWKPELIKSQTVGTKSTVLTEESSHVLMGKLINLDDLLRNTTHRAATLLGFTTSICTTIKSMHRSLALGSGGSVSILVAATPKALLAAPNTIVQPDTRATEHQHEGMESRYDNL
jgi:hypothetical protein